MRILLYAGPAPWRDEVIEFSAGMLKYVATSVTLVTGGGTAMLPLLAATVPRLQLPAAIPIDLRTLPGNAPQAIVQLTEAQPFDLVILGRLQQPLTRLWRGQRSKRIAERLEPSVLRVHGAIHPVRRILLTSGGDYHTLDNVAHLATFARPLAAEVTILHIISQQSVIFDGFVPSDPHQTFLASDEAEAHVLRAAAARFEHAHVPAHVRVRVGPVLDEILAELDEGDYDVLAVGAHRVNSTLDRILLEDITGDLLDRSPLPVLVVKGAD